MKLFIATENAGKMREMRAILAAAVPGIKVACVADLPADKRALYIAEETGATYAENALIKARALLPLVDGWVLAEDSGFEVDALSGEPGVYSARFAADDQARCAKVLAALENLPLEKRGAKFVACMVVLGKGGNPTFFYGRKEGFIAESRRGDRGFGYDPIFCPVAGGPTWAETGDEEKNKDSHRSQALHGAVTYLKSIQEPI